MDRSYPYSRRLLRRAQLHKRLGALAAFGVAGCALLYALSAPAPLEASDPAGLLLAAAVQPIQAQAADAGAGPRRIYPYSVVPGGVASARELGRVIREDKVVAAHYAEFDLAKAHEKTVTTPRAVHVSYRKGDKVYWTAKKVMLAEGEKLLSDGTHEARARCANQISDTPRLPVEAHGPSAEELDSSIVAAEPGADGGFDNVSFALPDQGPAGGFTNAAGNGAAATLSGGTAAQSRSLFAAADNAPGAPRGAWLGSGSGSGRTPGQAGSGGSNDGSGGSTGGSDGAGGGAPAPSTPAAGAPVAGGADTTPVTQPGAAAPSTPSAPSSPAAPGTPAAGGQPAAPGATPAAPILPTVPAPATPTVPDGGQSGGGGSDIPSLPPAGNNPAPGIPEGGPDSSPVPQPTLNAPQEPRPPAQDPAKPAEVPEPGTFWLVGAALVLMLVQRRRA